jgi:hypothetical protein
MERFTKVFFAAIFLLCIWGCDRKSCSHVTCPSYETCYNGQCQCPDGYQGANCDSLSASQYFGNWLVNENCGTGVPPNVTGYQVSILPYSGSQVNYIDIENLLNLGNDCIAQIYNQTPGTEGLSFYIPAQNVGGVAIANSYGTYSTATGAPVLTLVLNYNYQGINYSCQELMYKQ